MKSDTKDYVQFNLYDILEKVHEKKQISGCQELGGMCVGHGGSFEGDGTVFYLESDGVWLYNHIDTLKLIELVI